MSTIDPFVARRLADALGARGVAMLDAPVSGGTERAATGELSIIAGGAAETFEACRDLFKAMGAKIFHLGGIGQGLGTELVNNMLGQGNPGAGRPALVVRGEAGSPPPATQQVRALRTPTRPPPARAARRRF